MPYADVAGVRTYYEVDGNGSNLVLVHGAGQDTLSWRHIVPTLSRSARVWAVDLPGHGKSDFQPGGHVDDLGNFSQFLIGFLGTMAINRPTIVGHSMSAGVALITAIHLGDQVGMVVCVDGGGQTHGTYGDELLELVLANPADYFEENFRLICSPDTDSKRIAEIARDVTRCCPDVIYSDILAYSKLAVDDSVKAIRCPVAFIHGEDDWSIPPRIAAETRARLRVPSVMEIMKRTGHFPHVEQPMRFVDALMRCRAALSGGSTEINEE